MVTRLPQGRKPASKSSKTQDSKSQPKAGDKTTVKTPSPIDDVPPPPGGRKSHWLDLAENASLVCSGAGVVASVVLQQSMYASAPLSLALVLGLMNRRRSDQELQNLTNTSINQLDQKVVKNLNSLRQRVLALPTPETLDNVKEAIMQSNQEAVVAVQTELFRRLNARETVDLTPLQEEIKAVSEQQDKLRGSLLSANHLIQSLPSSTRVERLESAIASLVTETTQMQSTVEDLSDRSFPDLEPLQEQINHINRRFNSLPPPIDGSSLKREMEELVRLMGTLVPKRDFSAFQADLSTLEQRFHALEQVVHPIQSTLVKVTNRVENLSKPSTSDRSEQERIERLRVAVESLQRQVNQGITGNGDTLSPDVQKVISASTASLQKQVQDLQNRLNQVLSIINPTRLRPELQKLVGESTIQLQQRLTDLEQHLVQHHQTMQQQLFERQFEQAVTGTPEETGTPEADAAARPLGTTVNEATLNELVVTNQTLQTQLNDLQKRLEDLSQMRRTADVRADIQSAIASVTHELRQQVQELQLQVSLFSHAIPDQTESGQPVSVSATEADTDAKLQTLRQDIQANLTERSNQLQTQVVHVQTVMQELEERLNQLVIQASDRPSVAAIDGLQQRIAGLETELSATQQRLEQTLAHTLEQTLGERLAQTLDERLAQLSANWSTLANRDEIRDLSQKIYAIEQELAQSRQQLGQVLNAAAPVVVAEIEQIAAAESVIVAEDEGWEDLFSSIETPIDPIQSLDELLVADNDSTSLPSDGSLLDLAAIGTVSANVSALTDSGFDRTAASEGDRSDETLEDIFGDIFRDDADPEPRDTQPTVVSYGAPVTTAISPSVTAPVTASVTAPVTAPVLPSGSAPLTASTNATTAPNPMPVNSAATVAPSVPTVTSTVADAQPELEIAATAMPVMVSVNPTVEPSVLDYAQPTVTPTITPGATATAMEEKPVTSTPTSRPQRKTSVPLNLLENAQTLIAMALPWQEELDFPLDVLERLHDLLQRQGRVEIGWSLPRNEATIRTVRYINQRWHTTDEIRGYAVLTSLEELRQQYPDQVRMRLLGTYEKFLVCDYRDKAGELRQLALIGQDTGREIEPDLFGSWEAESDWDSLSHWGDMVTDSGIIQGLLDRVYTPAFAPTDTITYFSRAATRYGLGDRQGAIEDYTQVLRANPDDDVAMNNRGVVYYELGILHEALADFDQALQLHPTSVGYCNRGTVRSDLGDRRGALADYQKAIELDAASAIAYNGRGLIHSKLGNTERAIADYDEAIIHNPDYALAYFNRGAAYQKLMQRQAGIADYTETIRINPAFAAAYNNRGFLRYELGELEMAIADFDQALELNPSFANAYNNRGVVFSKQRNYQRAIADFDQALAINPQFANAYNNRGVAHSRLGNREQAIADLQNAARCFGELGDVINQQHTLDTLTKLQR